MLSSWKPMRSNEFGNALILVWRIIQRETERERNRNRSVIWHGSGRTDHAAINHTRNIHTIRTALINETFGSRDDILLIGNLHSGFPFTYTKKHRTLSHMQRVVKYICALIVIFSRNVAIETWNFGLFAQIDENWSKHRQINKLIIFRLNR